MSHKHVPIGFIQRLLCSEGKRRGLAGCTGPRFTPDSAEWDCPHGTVAICNLSLFLYDSHQILSNLADWRHERGAQGEGMTTKEGGVSYKNV